MQSDADLWIQQTEALVFHECGQLVAGVILSALRYLGRLCNVCDCVTGLTLVAGGIDWQEMQRSHFAGFAPFSTAGLQFVAAYQLCCRFMPFASPQSSFAFEFLLLCGYGLTCQGLISALDVPSLPSAGKIFLQQSMSKMADPAGSCSSNSAQSFSRQRSEVSDSRRAGSVSNKPTTRSKSKTSKVSTSVEADKDALHRQKALEKQFAKAQKLAEEARSNPVPIPAIEARIARAQEDQLNWSPEAKVGTQSFHAVPFQEHYVPQPVSSHRHSGPSATFTPTAAGLWPEENLGSDLSQELHFLIAQTISQGINSALQQRGFAPLLPLRSPLPTSSHLLLQSEVGFVHELVAFLP